MAHGVRRCADGTRLPVAAQHGHGVVGVDVMRKREAHAALRGEQGTPGLARAEQPQLGARHVGGDGADGPSEAGPRWLVVGQVPNELVKPLGEVVDGGDCVARAAQRRGRARIGAGGAAEPEVDAAGEERVQHAERLGDLQRRVVGEHDAARADAEGARRHGHLSDHDLGRRAREAPRVVVLGHPVAAQAERLGVPGEAERVPQRIARRRARRDRRQIEDREDQPQSSRAAT